MTRSITGLFPDRAAARRAITELSAAGFDMAHLGVVLPDTPARRDDTTEQALVDPATEAAVGGGVLGGTVGALLTATGALVIPGVGPFTAGGILASLVGETAGWLAASLMAQGLPQEKAMDSACNISLAWIIHEVAARRPTALWARYLTTRSSDGDLPAASVCHSIL